VEVLSEQQCPPVKLVLEQALELELARAQVLAQVAARVLQQV
jgi:hypothetical protein